VKVTVPAALLPLVACKVAVALGPPPPIIAHPASKPAAVAAAMASFIFLFV
jgi:hypothetical protein